MLKKSLIIATCITLTLFGIILYIGTLYGQYMPGDTSQYPPKNQGKGSRAFEYEFLEIGSASTYTLYYGTQSVTGSGTAGRITGTSSALPHVEYAYAGGTPTFNFVGATLQNEGVDVTVSSDLIGYIAVTGGTGTGNTMTNTTLDGAGTISANIALSGNITANSLEITPVELGYLNNASSEIQSQITTATGSITGHTHTGADGTAQIAHNSITGTGTNSHSTIDSFIASKAQASGLASLDGSSLVVQNPASGTSTPGVNKTVMSDGTGKILDGWLNSTITALGQIIEIGTETTGNTDNVAEGDSNLYYLDSRVADAIGSLSVSAHSDIVFTSPAEGHKLVFDSSLNVVNATDTAIIAWSGITGIPTDNGSVSVTSGAGYIPVAGGDGKLDYGWQKDVIRLTGTTTEQLAGAYGQLYVQLQGVSATSVGTNTTVLMTGNTAPSPYIVRASTEQGTQYGYKAFDRNLNEGAGAYWQCANGTTTAWLSYDYGTGTSYAITEYRITTTSGTTNAPRDWTFEGSNNNTNWTILDARTSQTSWTGSVYNTYTASNTGQYQFYRINITAANGGAQINILEMLLLQRLGIPAIQYSAKYADPINGNTVFEILTPGTATSEASYIYNNATTTVWGLGTNTAITGTTSGAYAGWTNRPIRVSAVDIASTKKIKENIKPIHIKPEQLEAESRAKPVYIADKKPAWFAANEITYTYVGSDTATYVDNAAMETDYASYIELEWASDLNQNVYIEAVQKAQQKYFWGLFDEIQPKSWNPIDDLRMTRKGLIVEEVPDEIKGADGQSIDQMAVVTYQTLVLQELKDSVVDIMQALRGLAATGTFTTQAIDDRLEVMRVAP